MNMLGMNKEQREERSKEMLERLIKTQDLNMSVDEFVEVYSSNRGIKNNVVNVWTNCEKYQFNLKGNKKHLLSVLGDSLNFLQANPKFNQDAYVKKFTKENYKHYHLMVNKKNTKVINQLEKQESKNAYIISLIEKDIKK